MTVKLTREKDLSLSLTQRVALARKWNADIFISIHANFASNTKASGLETYIVPCHGFPSTAEGSGSKNFCAGNKFDTANSLLAYYVHKGMLLQTKAVDRGIRRARFEVIKNAPCPAILAECGFLSNKAEAAKIVNKDYQNSIAEGISQGILTYVSKIKSGIGH